MRAAAALDEPAVEIDLVGAVDRDVQPLDPAEGDDVKAELARHLLGPRRGRHAADREAPLGERRQQVRDCGAGAEADELPVADELRGRARRIALLALHRIRHSEAEASRPLSVAIRTRIPLRAEFQEDAPRAMGI